jgi:hypothetical protein
MSVHHSYTDILADLLSGTTATRPRRRAPEREMWPITIFLALLSSLLAVYFAKDLIAPIKRWYYAESLARQKLEGDVAAMKKIVSGIVPAVKVIAESRQSPSLEEFSTEPHLAVVTSGRAHVRREAALDSESILTVPSGSVLLVKEVVGEWVSTLTPLGEPGWMHRSVLRME